MRRSHRGIVAGVLMAAMLCCVPGARAQEGGGAAPTESGGGSKATVRVGYLTCHVASGWGFIFGSSRKVKCAFSMSGSSQGYTEYYTGAITKFGADIGYMQSAVMLWTVVAPTTNLGEGSLSGHYGGATASVALGVGAGANVLVGGFKHSIALQPVSIEGQTGLNVAAGVVQLTLKFDKRKPPKSTSQM
ncbi:MAG TPA: DUF992 domain-containing protein [Candidatus Binataceae bacterium]|nr:DUF992 domain-containing protein [Candidatus Binataceae bacterium]